jgi:hypothetical protein
VPGKWTRLPAVSSSTLYDPEHPGGAAFLSFVNAWIELAGMLNELSRSMGQPDFYPSCCRRR